MSTGIKRRAFLGSVGAAAGAAVVADPLGSRKARAASASVYSAHSAKMVTGSPPKVQQTWVRAGVDACIKALTGKADVAQAWQAAFPGVAKTSKIAIKINCLRDTVSPQFEVIQAIVGGISSMFGGAFPAANISIFDNTMPFKGMGNNRMSAIYGSKIGALGVVHKDPSPQYASTTFKVKGKSKHPALYLDQADYGICLVPLKPHQYYAGGISGVIKNMMGACSESTSSFTGAAGTFHDKAPFSSFVDLFNNYMKASLQLYIVDMLLAAKTENANGWSKVINRITMGTDPCAVDAYVCDVLNAAGFSGTKGVPKALAAAGIGTTSYKLVQPTVTTGPVSPGRALIDAKIRDHRGGKASDADVKQLIKQYREAKP